MKKGLVLINSTHFSPTGWGPYKDYEVVQGDDLNPSLLTTLYDDRPRMVVFNSIPSKELLEKIVYPFIIYTQERPPKWLYDFAQVNDGKVWLSTSLNKLIQGDILSPEELHVLRAESGLAHLILTQNLHRLYDKPPKEFYLLERLQKRFMSDRYVQLLKAILRDRPPDHRVSVRYDRRRDWRKSVMEVMV